MGRQLRRAVCACRSEVQNCAGNRNRSRLMLHVDGQSSAVNWATHAMRRRSLPFFTGNGSKLAVTEGGQAVVIHGREFGPVGSTYITSVEYGSDTGVIFEAVGCTVFEAHAKIQCQTAPGAGLAFIMGSCHRWTTQHCRYH